MRLARRAAIVLAWLSASCEPEREGERLVNDCSEDFECSSGERCDQDEGRCVRLNASIPYRYIVQVAPTSRPELVARTITPLRLLEETTTIDDVRVARAALVQGEVLGSDGGTIEAELSFVRQPSTPLSLHAPSSAYTRRRDGDRFAALLDPSTFYSALVVPLGTAAGSHPPSVFQVNSAQRDSAVRYEELRELRGRLLSDQIPSEARSPFEGHRVRLRAKSDGTVTSSLATLSASGSFAVSVKNEVAMNLPAHELVLDLLKDEQPWMATLAIDGRRLAPQGIATITIPAIPARVPMRVRVVDPNENPIPADLTFVSSYQPPEGDAPMAERDWCRLRNQSSTQPSCSARLSFAIPSGDRQFDLLPGFYDVFVTPRQDAQSRRFATLATTENVTPQQNGEILGPVEYKLLGARRYIGRVSDDRGAAIADVSINAHALGLAHPEIGELTAYNRSATTLSRRDGTYSLPLDIGSYDLVVMPPDGSGFPWFVLPNRFVPPGGVDTYDVKISAPVLLRGSVADEQGAPLYAASVEAFALVPGRAGERPVRIARASSDDAGTFVLYMPPQIGDAPPPSLDGGLMDAGRRSDSGR